MDYEGWSALVQAAAAKHEAGDLSGAEADWRALAAVRTVPDLDRAMVLHNLAVTLAAAGRPSEAERAYDEQIAVERPWMRGNGRAAKANWLAGIGRTTEAAMLLEQLAGEGWSTGYERAAWLAQARTWRGNVAPSG